MIWVSADLHHPSLTLLFAVEGLDRHYLRRKLYHSCELLIGRYRLHKRVALALDLLLLVWTHEAKLGGVHPSIFDELIVPDYAH